ncbi:MAG TPA: Holliday junction branch migration protein RuvA [Candidatus Saccharimonadales bacterium]|jgi:Holliday junction DNA helicase RuvA
MIAQLRGKVVAVAGKTAVLDVGGIGYGVQVPDGLLSDIAIGQETELKTYHHIKENTNELFGFDSLEAKNLFELLIGISGVGPKSALAVMSLGPQDRIRQAIASENSNYLSGAAGVGKRSAQRICSELKDKVGQVETIIGADITGDDALEALLSLGYSRQQAAAALSKVDRQAPSEEQVKQALKDLS